MVADQTVTVVNLFFAALLSNGLRRR